LIALAITAYSIYHKIRDTAYQEGAKDVTQKYEKKIDDMATTINNRIIDLETASHKQAETNVKAANDTKVTLDKAVADIKRNAGKTSVTTVINGQCVLNEEFVRGYNTLTKEGRK
jgi:hypothetical protein